MRAAGPFAVLSLAYGLALLAFPRQILGWSRWLFRSDPDWSDSAIALARVGGVFSILVAGFFVAALRAS